MKKQNYYKNKGFSLPELMIVIGIIVILSAIILVSLQSVRDKGVNEETKQRLATAIVRAKLFYFANGDSFDGVCSDQVVGGSAPIQPILIDAAKTVKVGDMKTIIGDEAAGAWNTISCHDGKNYWVAEVPLRGSTKSNARMFCADSKGTQIEKSTNLGSDDTAC